MTLRYRQDHGIFHRTGIKLRRANQIAHILQHHKIQVIRTDLLKSLLRHTGIQMTHTAGVELDGLDPGGSNFLRIHVGVDIGFHNADIQMLLQSLNGTQQRGGLAAAG